MRKNEYYLHAKTTTFTEKKKKKKQIIHWSGCCVCMSILIAYIGLHCNFRNVYIIQIWWTQHILLNEWSTLKQIFGRFEFMNSQIERNCLRNEVAVHFRWNLLYIFYVYTKCIRLDYIWIENVELNDYFDIFRICHL